MWHVQTKLPALAKEGLQALCLVKGPKAPTPPHLRPNLELQLVCCHAVAEELVTAQPSPVPAPCHKQTGLPEAGMVCAGHPWRQSPSLANNSSGIASGKQ
jgi:hypothetical protein